MCSSSVCFPLACFSNKNLATGVLSSLAALLSKCLLCAVVCGFPGGWGCGMRPGWSTPLAISIQAGRQMGGLLGGCRKQPREAEVGWDCKLKALRVGGATAGL